MHPTSSFLLLAIVHGRFFAFRIKGQLHYTARSRPRKMWNSHQGGESSEAKKTAAADVEVIPVGSEIIDGIDSESFLPLLDRLGRGLCSDTLRTGFGGIEEERQVVFAILSRMGVNSNIYAYKPADSIQSSWPECSAMNDVVVKVLHHTSTSWGMGKLMEHRYWRRSFQEVCRDAHHFQVRAWKAGVAPAMYATSMFTTPKSKEDSDPMFYCIHFMRRARGPSLDQFPESDAYQNRKAWGQHFKQQLTKLSYAGIEHSDLHPGNWIFDCEGGEITLLPSEDCKLLILDYEMSRERSNSSRGWREKGNGVGDTKRLICGKKCLCG